MERRKKLIILGAVLATILAGGAIAYYYFLLTRVAPSITVEVEINGMRFGGGRWRLPLAIFEVAGEPLDYITVRTKMRWSVKYLWKEEWEKPVPVKFIAIAFWRIHGRYRWYGFGGIPGEEKFEWHDTYIPYGVVRTATDELLSWMGMNWKDRLKPYVGLIATRGDLGWWWSPLYLTVRPIAEMECLEHFEDYLDKCMMNDPDGTGKIFREKAPKYNLWEGFVQYVKEAVGLDLKPIPLKHGDEAKLYEVTKYGYELQDDLGWIVFDVGSDMVSHLHLVTDMEGDRIIMEYWLFIWYQWQDIHGKWSDVYYGAKKMFTLTIDVVPGNWITVGLEMSTTGIEEGTWVVVPEEYLSFTRILRIGLGI